MSPGFSPGLTVSQTAKRARRVARNQETARTLHRFSLCPCKYQIDCPQTETGAKSRFQSMRLVLLVILLFGVLAWDIAENNAHYTHMISREIDDLGQQLGLW